MNYSYNLNLIRIESVINESDWLNGLINERFEANTDERNSD